jgi:hypothetical protein
MPKAGSRHFLNFLPGIYYGGSTDVFFYKTLASQNLILSTLTQRTDKFEDDTLEKLTYRELIICLLNNPNLCFFSIFQQLFGGQLLILS